MKQIILVMIIVLLAACSNNEDNTAKQTPDIIKGKVTLADGSDAPINIFAYYDRNDTEESTLITKAKADAEGNFEIEIPADINYAMLHLAAPGYKSFEVSYIEGDESPQLEAALYKTAIPKDIDSVAVFIYDGERNFFNMKKQDDSTYVWEGELDSNAITYQVLFNDNTSQYDNSNDTEWEYDHAGDYLNVLKSDDNTYKIEINTNKFRKYGAISQRILTDGKWVDSPVNQKYEEIQKALPMDMVRNLAPSYYYLVKRGNDAALGGMTEDEIRAQAESVQRYLKNYKSIADSLSNVVESPYLKDYVTLIKHELKSVTDEVKYEETLNMLRNVTELPYAFYSLPAELTYQSQFFTESEKNMAAIDSVIAKTKDERNNNLIRFNLLYSLSNNDMHKNKYKDMIVNGINEMLASDNLDNWIKRSGPKIIQKLEISSLEHAPDFTFTDVNGKQHSLSDFKGKWVLVDFWGTWCAPCRGETPYLVDTYEQYKGNNFEIISISTDRAVSQVTDYMKEHNMNWVNTIEIAGYAEGIVDKYGVNSFPTLFLITPEGKFDRSVTEMDLRGDALKGTIGKKLESEIS